jgi:hypothetical protein
VAFKSRPTDQAFVYTIKKLRETRALQFDRGAPRRTSTASIVATVRSRLGRRTNRRAVAVYTTLREPPPPTADVAWWRGDAWAITIPDSRRSTAARRVRHSRVS